MHLVIFYIWDHFTLPLSFSNWHEFYSLNFAQKHEKDYCKTIMNVVNYMALPAEKKKNKNKTKILVHPWALIKVFTFGDSIIYIILSAVWLWCLFTYIWYLCQISIDMIKNLDQNPFGKKLTYFYLGLSDPIPSLREIRAEAQDIPRTQKEKQMQRRLRTDVFWHTI